jgi:hypothetical protein
MKQQQEESSGSSSVLELGDGDKQRKEMCERWETNETTPMGWMMRGGL